MSEDINLNDIPFMEIPKGFDINMFDVYNEGLDSHIKTGKNILGGSDIGSGVKRNVIKNLYGLREPKNNKMLMGQFIEAVIDIPDVLRALLMRMHKKLKLPHLPKLTYKEITKREDYWEAFPNELPGYLIRMHPDIFTEFYTLEIKGTGLPKFKWTKELAPRHVAQENFYMHYYKTSGFLYQLNINAFLSKISQGDDYWDKLHRDYEYFVPIYPDKEFFELCLARLKFMFKAIDTKDEYQECPSNLFECNGCICIKHCKNPITKGYIDFTIKCTHCGKDIELTKKASEDFTALALERNGVYYHSSDPKHEDGKYDDCRQAAKDAWRVEQDE